MKHAVEPSNCPARRTAAQPLTRAAGPSVPACAAVLSGSGSFDPMPSDATERALVLVLRCLAAAGETGDALCWDAAFDRAEQAFGPRDGTLVVARVAALHRSLARSGSAPYVLPLPCRRLSRGEADLLKLFRASIGIGEAAERTSMGSRLSIEARRALTDLADAVRSTGQPATGCAHIEMAIAV